MFSYRVIPHHSTIKIWTISTGRKFPTSADYLTAYLPYIILPHLPLSPHSPLILRKYSSRLNPHERLCRQICCPPFRTVVCATTMLFVRERFSFTIFSSVSRKLPYTVSIWCLELLFPSLTKKTIRYEKQSSIMLLAVIPRSISVKISDIVNIYPPSLSPYVG